MYKVTDYGAVGDGRQLDSGAIQKAIDACAEAGGGTVLLTAGVYRCGTIVFKSNVILYLDAGAKILGSDDLADYSEDVQMFVDAVGHKRGRCLIYANNVKQIGITGTGVIDGNGEAFLDSDPRYKERPFLLRMVDCQGVHVETVSLTNSAAWVSHYLQCSHIRISGVTIQSRVNENNDGIDIDSCQDVRISDCSIDTGDDSICLKTTTSRPCRNIVVSNCVISSGCGAIKLGTESVGDMNNIVVSNCAIYETGMCGIKIISMDGSVIENVVMSNITMYNVTGPIFIRLGNRGRTYFDTDSQRPAGKIKNVSVSNIEALVKADTKDRSGMLLTGIEGHCIEDLTLQNIAVTYPGGGTKEDINRSVPEQTSEYPEHHFFGVLPSYGMYLRHIRNIHLSNIRLNNCEPDLRPAVSCEDVTGLTIDRVLGDRVELNPDELLKCINK